ncbi:sensor histidine kinase [Streptomyces sp. NPDC059096]|uniref:sensor histidine kinase n=1 Tax=Streptomyces sp. NPDC059096 TaxID=3346727 RepID=UPI00368EC411
MTRPTGLSTLRKLRSLRSPRDLRRVYGRSNSAWVELYTRYTFYGMAGIEFGATAPNSLGEGRYWTALLILTHSVLCCLLALRAMDWRLGRRPQPVPLMLAVGGVSGAAVLGLIVLTATGAIGTDERFGGLLMTFGGFGVATMTLGLRTTAQRATVVFAPPAAAGLVTLLAGLEWRQAALNFAGITTMGVLLGAACVFTLWLVGVVWELDGAHELRTRLAVAEERLRFGRDLHDVMGRNLAVIALKSELAVQLAERGRPEAMTQMTEVQRIARESQREVRDVVRGYREANLHTELEGARGVLEAAGIDCRIDGIGTIEGGLPIGGEAAGHGGPRGAGGKGGKGRRGVGLPAEVQSALGWVVREATTNVLRHGDPRRCTVRLSEQPLGKGGSGDWEAVLTVENDGVPDSAPDGDGDGDRGADGLRAKGSGLAGLRERLAAVDGTLEAGPTGKGGFRLTARVPLPEERPEPRPKGPTTGRSTGPSTGPGADTEVAA